MPFYAVCEMHGEKIAIEVKKPKNGYGFSDIDRVVFMRTRWRTHNWCGIEARTPERAIKNVSLLAGFGQEAWDRLYRPRVT